MKIEKWWYDSKNNIVWGDIYGDVNGVFKDGSYIHTPSLVDKGELAEGVEIETLKNVYTLGTPIDRTSYREIK
jgi:hypothetical protein